MLTKKSTVWLSSWSDFLFTVISFSISWHTLSGGERRVNWNNWDEMGKRDRDTREGKKWGSKRLSSLLRASPLEGECIDAIFASLPRLPVYLRHRRKRNARAFCARFFLPSLRRVLLFEIMMGGIREPNFFMAWAQRAMEDPRHNWWRETVLNVTQKEGGREIGNTNERIFKILTTWWQ